MSISHEAWFMLTAFPAWSLAALILILAAPLMLWGVRGPVAEWPTPARWYARVVVATALAGGVVMAVRYLYSTAPLVEGVDFYYQVLTARDCLRGAPPAAADRYVYFPGGWRIWQAAMAVFGVRLEGLQWTFVGLLVANVALVGSIVGRAADRPLVGFVAGLWYLALASRMEGLEGTTEPLATSFALVGLLAWGGERLESRAGALRAVALGAGLGMAVWAKQQGVLVAAGALGLILAWLALRRRARHSLRLLLLIPASALTLFLGCILLEGEGLAPIRIGLSRAQTYEAEGSLPENMRVMWSQSGWIGWLALLAAVLWLAVLVVPRLRRLNAEPWAGIVGFAIVAGMAGMAQFAKRPYLHYALLIAPFMVIAAAVVLSRAYDAMPAHVREGTPARCVLAFALVMPLLGGRYASHFHVWPPTANTGLGRQVLWHEQPLIREDVRAVGALVPPGSRLVVFPQRRNVFHLLFETTAPTYRWGGLSAKEVVQSFGLKYVLVLEPRVLDESDLASWRARGTDHVVTSLDRYGFVCVVKLDTMSLWQRVPHRD